MKGVPIAIGIVALLICVSVFPSIQSMKLNTQCIVSNSKESLMYDAGTDITIANEVATHRESAAPRLKIEDITANGNGITITIKNVGNIDVSNVELDVESEGGIFISLPKTHYKLSMLSAGSSTSIQISILGFGIGQLTEYPKFTFTIRSPDVPTVVGKATAKVLGPFAIIICESYDSDASFEGYTLFAPMWDRKTYLMDNDGNIVHSWTSIYLDTQAAYLLENGNLVRTSIVADSSIFSGGGQGRIEMFDWSGKRVWKFEYSTDQYCQHHDVEPLPNGNILIVAWELKTAEEAIAAGRNPNKIQGDEFWPDHIIEVEPTGSSGGNIVWEWHAWDHLVQDYDPMKDNYGILENHPELLDINYGGQRADWLHINSVDYNEKFDQILLCVHNFHEIWVVDHSTTTEEAAGHTGGRYGKGGDILYRWGNPQTYGYGNASDQKFFGQHDAKWIEEGCPGEGHITVFNNGGGRFGGRYPSVEEIIPPVDKNGNYFKTPGFAYGPEEQIWIYTTPDPSDMYSGICSSAQRLPNGNTLICSAQQGLFLEVTHKKEIVWEYVNNYPWWFAQKSVPEIIRYPPDYPGLKDLFI